MKRFNKMPPDKYGNVVITDILNSEPVCTIYGKYHPYAIKVIFDALDQFQSIVPTKKCKCGKSRIPVEWLHCGCGQYDL